MNFYKAIGLGMAAIVLVACGTQGNVNQEPMSKTKITVPEKDPKITAAEQLAFVLCKKKQGNYKTHHDKDMRKVLSAHNIDNSLLDSDEVKTQVQKYIDDGACDFYAEYDRVGDLVPKQGEGKAQFKNLIGWEREVVVAMSEGECKTQFGEFGNQERENYVMKKLDKISYPSDLGEDEMVVKLKTNLPAVFWLIMEKTKNKNCSWMPE